ncbi:MAG: ABC transporter ATP-binding protein [Chromatiaceae bacterium]|nr:ABC transporter ATP-binding protein [Chromatiaceae bacterium]
MPVVIQVEHLSKYYRLGLIGGGTLREDLNRWWAKARGRPDPLLKIGDTDHGNRVGGELWALRDVSFEVREGEILGIIGRNGAGKSTLLKILSRITAPTTGLIKIKGRVGSLLEVGTGFHPELTGRENIYLNGAILGMKKAEIDRKIDEIIDFSEIGPFIDTPVKRYSSGMYVRLAFAVAAHLEPEILIVDEVLAVGDAEFQKKCLGKMGDIADGGRTVLFVSHNMQAVSRLCPKAMLLKQGAIAELGNTDDVCQSYLASRSPHQAHKIIFKDHGDHIVFFSELEMFDSLGRSANHFRADEPIRFCIRYHVDIAVSGLTLGINITDGLGGSLWAASELDCHPELFDLRRSPGDYELNIIAPGNVLRPGQYQVALGAASGGQYHHHPQDFPSFVITIEGYWRESHRFFGLGGGPIAVPMDVKAPVLLPA